jgi:enolase-phosphatase E1
VAPFFHKSLAEGKKIMIYSSGSVPAQKLLFGHTNSEPSDMRPLISDWFDTVNAGPKTDVSSYRAIQSKYAQVDPARWLFFSDNLNEVTAALESGMRSLPVMRPGNPPLPPDHHLSKHGIPDFTAQSAESGRASIAELAG